MHLITWATVQAVLASIDFFVLFCFDEVFHSHITEIYEIIQSAISDMKVMDYICLPALARDQNTHEEGK